MADQARPIILHIEDDPQLRSAMAMLLRNDCFIHSAASGEEALRWTRDGLRPDVLIVDYNLHADMNGADASEQIRSAIGYAPPIIMLTADPASAELPWITDAPMWLARKPLSPEVLLTAIPPLVELSRALRRHRQRPPSFESRVAGTVL